MLTKYYKITFNMLGKTRVWQGRSENEADAMDSFINWAEGLEPFIELYGIESFTL